MNLDLQLKAIIISYLYGLFFTLTTYLFHKQLFQIKTFAKIVINLIFSFSHFILYFLILYRLNNCLIHPYFFLSLAFGIITVYIIKCKVTKKSSPFLE